MGPSSYAAVAFIHEGRTHPDSCGCARCEPDRCVRCETTLGDGDGIVLCAGCLEAARQERVDAQCAELVDLMVGASRIAAGVPS